MAEQKKMIEGIKVGFLPEEIEDILANTRRCLETGRLIRDWALDELEGHVAKSIGKAYAGTFASDTSAQEILFRTLKEKYAWFQPKVLFQGNMFPSPVFAAMRAGFTPVFADVALDNAIGVTTDSLDAVCDKDVKVLVIMHTGGMIPPNVDKLQAWARAKGIVFVEDCAHSYASTWRGLPAGTMGDYAVYSFYATKPMTMGEGAIIAGNDKEVVDRCVQYARYGKTELFGPPICPVPGYSARMSELQAAMGCAVLKHLDKKLKRRREVAARYRLEIKGVRHFDPKDVVSNYYKYPVMPPRQSLPSATVRLPHLVDDSERQVTKKKFAEAGIKISAGVYDTPCPTQPCLQMPSGHLTVTADFTYGHLCLPMHEFLAEDDVTRVVEVTNQIFPNPL